MSVAAAPLNDTDYPSSESYTGRKFVIVSDVSRLVPSHVLRKTFELLGPVMDWRFFQSATDQNVNGAVLEFATWSQIDCAVHLDGTQMGDRRIAVRFASETEVAQLNTSLPPNHVPILAVATAASSFTASKASTATANTEESSANVPPHVAEALRRAKEAQARISTKYVG